MEILFLLIPLSAVLVLCICAVFASALQGGQFDDLESQGERFMAADDAPIDPSQAPPSPSIEESNHRLMT